MKFFSYAGLPLAYSISQITVLVIFLMVLNKKFIKIPLIEMLKTVFFICVGGFSILILLWQIKNAWLLNISYIWRLIILLPVITILYLIICTVLRVEEAKRTVKYIISFNRQRGRLMELLKTTKIG